MLHGQCCIENAVLEMLNRKCCILCIVCCVLYVLCCVLCAACCLLRVVCCVWCSSFRRSLCRGVVVLPMGCTTSRRRNVPKSISNLFLIYQNASQMAPYCCRGRQGPCCRLAPDPNVPKWTHMGPNGLKWIQKGIKRVPLSQRTKQAGPQCSSAKKV